jgi:hypothetical protein
MGDVSNEHGEISPRHSYHEKRVCGKMELWYPGRILLVYCERNPRKVISKENDQEKHFKVVCI